MADTKLEGRKVLLIVPQTQFREEEVFEPKRILEKQGAQVVIASGEARICRGIREGTIEAEVAIADVLERELGAPVHAEHNVRAMALAEAHYADVPPSGRHRASSLAYVYLRKRLGLGLVMHGSVSRGGAHGVSELGHIQVDPSGPRCPCGNRGCLETLTSTVHLRARLEAAGADLTGVDDLDILTVVDAARGTPVHDEFIGRMAQGLSIVANLTGPDAIVLGGSFAAAPDRLFDDLAVATAAATFPLVRPSVVIRRARLVEGGVAGAAAVALDATVYGAPA